MTTATRNDDLRDAMNSGNPSQIAMAEKRMKAGNMASVIKVIVSGLTAAAAVDVTAAATKAAATVSGINLRTGENLPPIGVVTSLQLVASGTAASLGSYIVAPTGTPPAGGTPLIPPGGAQAAVGVATLSDDGKTLTFPNTVTGFILTYMPRSDVAMTTEAPPGAPY